MKGNELERLKTEVSGWEVVGEHHLHKVFRFPDFKKALDFVNRAGAIAEEQSHHPDILLAWGKAEILRSRPKHRVYQDDEQPQQGSPASR